MILLVGAYILNKVLSIFGHILFDFMQIFQDGALPYLFNHRQTGNLLIKIKIAVLCFDRSFADG